MDAFQRLQFQLMWDEVLDRWRNILKYFSSFHPKRRNQIAASEVGLAVDQESEGRVWVEVGSEGLRLRVTHLHPANPSVAESLKRKCSERRKLQYSQDGCRNHILKDHLIYPPEEDEISLSSLEDYWFNHWQGPFIRTRNSQSSSRSSKLRRSHRKSKTFRCSTCHKKRIRINIEKKNEGKSIDKDKSMLSHMPSIKLDRRPFKEESDDEETSDDAVSRCSASDEHLARAYRVLDHELKTGFTLFADESVSQDVVDSQVLMNAPNELISYSSGGTQPALSPLTNRESKSCPCSPKLTSKTYSPKSRSFMNASKFSLSSSFLSVHRQASNTFMSEFLKFDNSKSESPVSRKGSSCKVNTRRIRHSSSDAPSEEESSFSKNDFQVDIPSEGNKVPAQEARSVPPLRLSKMSITYRSGVIISEENEGLESEDGAVAMSSAPQGEREERMLPDLIPDVEINREASGYCNRFLGSRGVINLGFDGVDESSDFVDRIVDGESATPSERGIPAEKDKRVTDPDRNSSSSSSICPSNKLDVPCSAKAQKFGTLPNFNSHCEDGDTLLERDVMQQARNLVFWWRKKSFTAEEESEFCLHEAECKVKQKPLVMFLHGIGSSADVWNQQLWYFLSCGYEVVAPDLLGHGMSSAPKNKKFYGFSNMLDYISLVFDLFVPQGRKCVLIGHNYGCALAVALARGRALSVSLIVLASCGGPSPLVPFSNYETSLSSFATGVLTPFISCGCLSRQLLYTPRGKHYTTVLSDDKGVSSTPRYVLENVKLGQFWPEGDLSFHRRITVPTLLLHGMKDNTVPFVEMCEMEKTIPRAFLEMIPGGGHELMTEAAEEVCHSIHRFIRRWKNLLQ